MTKTASRLEIATNLLSPYFIMGESRQGTRINALCRCCDQQFVVDRFKDAFDLVPLIVHAQDHGRNLCRFCDSLVGAEMLAKAKASLAESSVEGAKLHDFLFCSDECVRAKYWG